MKICILSIVNIKHMSLISLYTTFFDKYGIEYDIIYIDKYNEEEKTTANRIYRYPIFVDREWSKLRKLLVYWGFKSFAEKIINENKYDFVIVWRSETAHLFVNLLARKMKGKYCLNIRDYCMEENFLIFKRIRKVIKNSCFTTISSEGFESFLPRSNYLTVHSYNDSLLNQTMPKKGFKKIGEPINICFIGYVRFFETDKKLIDALGNDSRYVLQFFGEGSHYLEDYAKKRNIKNMEFIKGFKVEETGKLLQKADVINNLYGNNNIALDTAISTRYYYALYMNIPILVFQGTYMEKVSHEAGIGFAVSEDFSTLADDFYTWYHSLDFNQFKSNCKDEIARIHSENREFNFLLKNIFLKNRTGKVSDENK